MRMRILAILSVLTLVASGLALGSGSASANPKKSIPDTTKQAVKKIAQARIHSTLTSRSTSP